MNRITILLALIFSGLNDIKAAKKRYDIPFAQTVLVFSPHPDDDILGCGGAIIKHVREGSNVVVVYMTSGDAEKFHGTPQELAQIREQEAKRATERIGVHELIFFREPDSKLARSRENVSKIVALFKKYKPEVVYVPHQFDNHRDHKTTHWLVSEAVKIETKNNPNWKVLGLCYEVWTPILAPTHKINISKDMNLKLEALREHKSQLAVHNYVDVIQSLNRYRGITQFVGDYAECFDSLK